MKKLTLILALTLALLLTGCASGAGEDIPTADPATWEGGSIVWSEYAWGTGFETIQADVISDEMVEGEDYACYEDLGSFGRELIVNGEMEGQPCQFYYSFDGGDQLVAVMVKFTGEADEDFAQFYVDQVDRLKEENGQPGAVGNDYEAGDYQDMETYLEDVEAEGSFAVWTDDTGSQLIASFYKNGRELEAIVRCCVSGYTE